MINGSGGVPTSWAIYGGSSVASTLVKTLGPKNGFLGNAQGMQRLIPDILISDAPQITTGFSAGDSILAGWVFQLEGCEAGGANVTIVVKTNGASGGFNIVLNAVDVGPTAYWNRFTVPAGTTSIEFYSQISNGWGRVSVGQITVIDETTGGLLI